MRYSSCFLPQCRQVRWLMVPVFTGMAGCRLLLLATLCHLMSASASFAKTEKSCAGVDMIEEMRGNSPDSFAQISSKALSVKNDGAILWRITKDDKPTSYLFGTLHLSDPRISKLSKKVRAALDKAEVLALEVEDLSAAASSKAISQAADLILFKDGKRLSDFLTEDELKKVQKKLSKVGLPAQTVPHLKPWIVSLLTAVGPCERKRVKSGKLVLDMNLAAQARKRGIPIVGLETIQAQLKAASSISMDEQLKNLRTGLAYSDRSNDLMETLISLYIKRRIGSAIPFQEYLASRAGIQDAVFKGFQRELIVKRNRNMRTRSLPLLGKGRAFIAVGALHIVGENGLVALFRRAGYDVTPVE